MGRCSRTLPRLIRAGGVVSATLGFLLCLALVPAAHAQNAAKSHRKVVVMIDPEYPAVLRNGHFEGQVRLEATVQPNGSVTKVDIKGGNPMLSEYAAQAVMKWKYAPGPDKTVEEVSFRFNANEH